ncbi:MAG TPA: [Fe-Fe] hydrogenase large subunit C-terminal domain-containing protein [Treponemataceae bacterium]|nr:[Fe-Fe] hydrogenase large subunit C-terminal domain-containing protein [Treponemataceae bacterium]
MQYRSPVYTEKTQCQDCYKCIRECPVKAIRVEGGHATILTDLCVLCGHCVTVCPAGAKRVRDDLDRARQLLRLKDRVFVSLAPSFASEFAEIDPAGLVRAIVSLGFAGVSETAIGADLVSAELAEDFRRAAAGDRGQRLILSSACPVAVEYVKRYRPELAPYVADRASPLLAHARFLRARFGDDVGVVFVGPCVAKKREADVWGEIDCAITFGDLRRWLEETGTRLPRAGEGPEVDPGFVPRRAAKGALYPVDGGMIESIRQYAPGGGVRAMAASGLGMIERTLRGLEPETLKAPLFLELLACPGGCVNGPGACAASSGAARRMSLLDYAEGASAVLDEARPTMTGTLPVDPVERREIGEDELRAALRQVGKRDARDELNCGSCGYDTCRGFARAMVEGRAERTMCVSYMRALAQKKANGLIRAIPSGVVIADAGLHVIECNENFARLMGDEIVSMYEARPGLEGADLAAITDLSRLFRDVLAGDGPEVIEREVRDGKRILHATVFSVERGECACGVVQDVTAPQVRRDRVIKQTRRVIDKNLAVVQKIAFLLGENAAETEATLNSIVESFAADEGDES